MAQADQLERDVYDAAQPQPAAKRGGSPTRADEHAAAGAVEVLLLGAMRPAFHELAESLAEAGFTLRDSLDVCGFLSAGKQTPPRLVLADGDRAGFDAVGFLRAMARDPHAAGIPTIVFGESRESAHKLEAFSAGAVDYLDLPMEPGEILARVLVQLRLRGAQLASEAHSRNLESFVLEQFREITDSQMATIIALARLAESRDDQTGGHLERVQQYCRILAERLSADPAFGVIDHTFVDNIECASALHDVGKVGISDAILLKPTSLTPEEFELMKAHTTLGAQTLEAVSEQYPNNDFVAMGIKIARWHHERWDGQGYPDGLAGEEIPLAARIMAVADVYDALTSPRTYKGCLSHTESRTIIAQQAGRHFDPAIVEAFLDLEEAFRAVHGRLVPETR